MSKGKLGNTEILLERNNIKEWGIFLYKNM